MKKAAATAAAELVGKKWPSYVDKFLGEQEKREVWWDLAGCPSLVAAFLPAAAILILSTQRQPGRGIVQLSFS